MARDDVNKNTEAASGKTRRTKGDPICENLSFAGREAYKRLRTNVLFSFAAGGGCRVIGVISAQPAEGKSTTAINFAFSLAELGKRVLLIDGDMRRPSVSTRLNFEQTPGLSNLLVGENNIGAAVKRYRSGSEAVEFDVMTAGEIPPNPAELLNSERMARLLEKLRELYDYIVMDLPPVGAVADAQTVSRLADGMIIVVRENNCPRQVLDDCVTQLRFVNAKILGFVMNGSEEGTKGGYGKYGYGGYGYY